MRLALVSVRRLFDLTSDGDSDKIRKYVFFSCATIWGVVSLFAEGARDGERA